MSEFIGINHYNNGRPITLGIKATIALHRWCNRDFEHPNLMEVVEYHS